MHLLFKVFVFVSVVMPYPLSADTRDDADKAASVNALAFLGKENLDTQAKLFAARSLRCVFQVGRMAIGKEGTFSFQDGPFNNDGGNLQLDGIDLKAGTARVIGNAGAEDVQVLAMANGINFIELPGATLNLYTVFSAPTGQKDEFYAVTSRHAKLAGVPAPSQYTGKCKIWGQ